MLNLLSRLKPTIRLVLVVLFLSAAARAADIPEEYAHIEATFPDVEITSIQPSPIDGLLEMSVGAEFFYVTEDAKHVFRGDIFTSGNFVNLTEQARGRARSAYLASIDDESSILFEAEDSEYTITVFTDIDCGYCRKLHREMDDYHEAGISVRYLFFPRSGPDTESWYKAERVWCAESRQKALTMAKSNLKVESEDCGDTPIADHFEIVNALNLRGTPAIFTEGGTYIMGYRSADELLEVLEEEDAS